MAGGGLAAVEQLRVQPGNPVRVMLAQRLSDADQILARLGGRCAAEYKYDGIRVQAHRAADGRVELFTRRLEEISGQFPDVAALLAEGLGPAEAIIEGEVVAYDAGAGELRPFGEVMLRRRKHGIDQAVQDVPVGLFCFELLYADGEDLTMLPYPRRRAALEAALTLSPRLRLTTAAEVADPAALDATFARAVTDGCEGLVCKSTGPDSVYQAGARGWQWIKLKRDYRTELGRRTGVYGAVLLAAYDADAGAEPWDISAGTGSDAISRRRNADRRTRAAIAGIGDDDWTAIEYPQAIWDDQLDCLVSDAEVAEIQYTAFASKKKSEQVTARLIVRRVRARNDRAPEGMDELFPVRRYHAVFSDSPFELAQAEGQHRDHAIAEQVIADLYAGALAHLPSGHFGANSAWLVIAAMAHNLLRAAGTLAGRWACEGPHRHDPPRPRRHARPHRPTRPREPRPPPARRPPPRAGLAEPVDSSLRAAADRGLTSPEPVRTPTPRGTPPQTPPQEPPDTPQNRQRQAKHARKQLVETRADNRGTRYSTGGSRLSVILRHDVIAGLCRRQNTEVLTPVLILIEIVRPAADPGFPQSETSVCVPRRFYSG